MTVRRLIVMRHAKSSWDDRSLPDHARPLNKRGRAAAPLIAEHLERRGWTPDAVYSSDSQRTRETWSLMQEAFGRDDIPVVFTRDLYLAGLADIRASAADWSGDAGTVLVLGHNPGWEQAATELSRRSSSMTTANAAGLVGDGETWAAALTGDWTREFLLRPKELE